jgi:hypothetical protein
MAASVKTQSGRSANFRAARLGVLLAIPVALAGTARAADYVKAYKVSARPTVHVVTNDGSVRVRSGDPGQVEIRVEYEHYDLDKTLHIDAAQHGDQIDVTVRTSSLVFGIGLNRRVHIEVRMPENGDLQAETSDGSVEASALSGTISLRTHDGSVRADHLSGTMDLSTRDGSVTVAALRGKVRLHTGDGSIDGHDLDGQCDASTRDGSVHLAGRFDGLVINSGDGSVDARAQEGSKLDSSWSIKTSSGTVTVALPRALAADLDASTSDGHIQLDMPVTVDGVVSTSRIHGKINGGGQTLTIHTGDGAIHVLPD